MFVFIACGSNALYRKPQGCFYRFSARFFVHTNAKRIVKANIEQCAFV
jgi:hypothetical protein